MGNNFLDNIINEIDSDLGESQPPTHEGVNDATAKTLKINRREKPKNGIVREAGSKRNSKPRSRAQSQSPSTEHRRAFAKARIQKSIRFRPDLIARLDTYLEQLEQKGEEPISLQQAQNEALRLWLDSKNAR